MTGTPHSSSERVCLFVLSLGYHQPVHTQTSTHIPSDSSSVLSPPLSQPCMTELMTLLSPASSLSPLPIPISHALLRLDPLPVGLSALPSPVLLVTLCLFTSIIWPHFLEAELAQSMAPVGPCIPPIYPNPRVSSALGAGLMSSRLSPVTPFSHLDSLGPSPLHFPSSIACRSLVPIRGLHSPSKPWEVPPWDHQ
jgi:hypothetical protein